MSKATLRRIRQVELFEGCRRSQLTRIDQLGFTISVPPGRALCVEGKPGSEFFVLLDGLVEVRTSTGDVALLRPGAWFGEAALIDNAPRRATVRTRVASELIVYNRREFNTLVALAPSVRERLVRSGSRIAEGLQPAELLPSQPIASTSIAQVG
jgi:CRP-like cAMP-binding protein